MKPLKYKIVSFLTNFFLILLFFASLSYFAHENYLSGSSSVEVIQSSILMSIPLGLLHFSLWLIVKAVTEKTEMSPRIKKFIYWTPRLAGIVIAVFLGLFSFDVFDTEANILMLIASFLVHSIPSMLIFVIVYFSWKKEEFGFWAYLVFAILFSYVVFRNSEMIIGYLLLFILPLLFISILYWINWKLINDYKKYEI